MNTTENPTIVYLRVSTAEQETDSQEHQVLEYCKVRGWQPPLILRDAASGASSSRPGLEQMLAQVRAGGVHQVVTYKLDRLGRSSTHLAIIVGELQMRNVALICTSQGIDTSKQNPVGQPAIDFIGLKSTVMVKITGQRVVSAGAKSCRR